MNYQFEVLTVRDLDFQDQSGKDVSGMQLWVIGATTDKSWNGYEVSKMWIPSGSALESNVAQLKRGDKINVTFNRRGKPETIELI
ncbi:MAG: hypothetical protein E7431_02470 [Ruminococcaceae bacterium]|nr:hypothetical protein [Oscillospiraceae bacterium]